MDSVVYSFELVDGRSGKFTINETTGNTELIEPLPDDDGSLFARAAYNIKKVGNKTERTYLIKLAGQAKEMKL